MPRPRPRKESPPGWTDRLGSASLGLLAGLAAGLVAWIWWLKLRDAAPPLAACVFGGGGLGALLGFVSMDLGFGFVELLAAMSLGFFGAAAAEQGRSVADGSSSGLPADLVPRWRRALAWACVAVGVVAYLALVHT